MQIDELLRQSVDQNIEVFLEAPEGYPIHDVT